MIVNDDNNVTFADSVEAVDKLNSGFYGRFQFPWPPTMFERVLDPVLETKMLNQSIGSWHGSDISPNAKIWVAGCGTNQAVITALKFPKAKIIGTDLSSQSIQTANRSARQLGITNLALKQESINDSQFQDEFDYIICTGVVHHNANPDVPLRKLRAALSPSGICELMVYNKYHRIWTTAFQKTVQAMTGMESGTDLDKQLEVTRSLLRCNIDSSMAIFFEMQKNSPEAAIADACIQPVEHSYTVESLELLLEATGFSLLTPCINQFDKDSGNFLWNMGFAEPELAKLYNSLPDSRRWQITNLLLLERSPALWFYIQRTDCARNRKSEEQLCREFLDYSFVRSRARKQVYIQGDDKNYTSMEKLHSHPTPHGDPLCRKVLEVLDQEPNLPMRTVLTRLGVALDFSLVNKLRVMLTTCAFPYLLSSRMKP